MLQQQRAKSIGIDNLVKNLITKKSLSSKTGDQEENLDLEKLMSAMNENDAQSHVMSKNSIGSPSSPSSLSSASSTTSNHSSTNNNHTQNAVQAAVQALLAQHQPNMGLLTADNSNKSDNHQSMQQQQQLNQLLASIAAAQQQQQNSQQSTNALLNNLMQQQLDSQGSNKKVNKNLNVKTKQQNISRSQKGNSVSPPGTSSTCSDDHDLDSMQVVKNEPNFNAETLTAANIEPRKSKSLKNEFEDDLDRSTNSSASQDINQADLHESHHDHDQDDLEDELDDYEHSFTRDSKRHRNHSTSSRTHSNSSNRSRSTSPSTTSYHDSPAAFPTLESATAMLGGLNCTPGMSSFLDTTQEEGGKKRRLTSGDSNKKIKPVPADKKDEAYWERRRKNNEAAKRSRDLRRQKEDEIAVKATVLEQENLKLKAQVTILKAELSKLHFMLYNR